MVPPVSKAQARQDADVVGIGQNNSPERATEDHNPHASPRCAPGGFSFQEMV